MKILQAHATGYMEMITRTYVSAPQGLLHRLSGAGNYIVISDEDFETLLNENAPAPTGISLEGLPDGTVQVIDYDGETSFTILVSDSSIAAYNGSVEFTIADFANGPQVFFAGTGAGTPEVGQTLSAVLPVAYLYDDDYGEPVIDYYWARGGIEIAGTKNASYVATVADQGTIVSLVYRLTQLGGRVTTVTAANFAIPAATHLYQITSFDDPPFTDGALISSHPDFALLVDHYGGAQKEIYIDAAKGVALIEDPLSANVGGWAKYTIENNTPGADQYIEVNLEQLALNGTTEYMELILRQGASGYFFLQLRQNGGTYAYRIYSATAAHALTQLDHSATWADDILNVRFEAVGTELRVYADGELVRTVTGATQHTAGKTGIGMYRGWHTDAHIELRGLAIGNVS